MKLFVAYISLILIGFSTNAQVPLNWSRDEINPGEDFTLTPDESVFSEGVKSCHLQLNSGAVPYLVSNVYFLTPGASYEFSFDVFDNDTAGQVKVYADFYDPYGFEIFGQPPVFSSDTSAWQTISWEGIVPSQAIVGFVLIKFYNQPNLYNFTKTAHIWIDNIQFREAGGNNLVANGGFEEWLVSIDDNRNNNNNTLFIYPVPAKDDVNLTFPGIAKFIVISDLMGRELFRITAPAIGKYQLDISLLPDGLYLSSVVRDDNRVFQGKLIVSRR